MDRNAQRDEELDALIDEADRYMRVRGVPLHHKLVLMDRLMEHYRKRKEKEAAEPPQEGR